MIAILLLSLSVVPSIVVMVAMLDYAKWQLTPTEEEEERWKRIDENIARCDDMLRKLQRR